MYIGIDEQLVKDRRIQTKLINFSFEVFNMDVMIQDLKEEVKKQLLY